MWPDVRSLFHRRLHAAFSCTSTPSLLAWHGQHFGFSLDALSFGPNMSSVVITSALSDFLFFRVT